MVRARSVPVDVTEGGEVGPLRQMLVGISAISSSTSAATLVAFSIVATLVFGVDTVLFVVLSDQVLGTGAEGYGYLLAGLGVGGVLAAGLVPRLERLPRLGVVIWLCMALYCLPTLLFLVVDQPAAAFVIQCFRGASTLFVDVLAVTALQRSLPHDVLGRVFGAFNALMLLAILVGSSLVPVCINALGLDAVLWISGLGVPALCLLGAPWLRRMDREAAVRRTVLAPKVDLLARCDLFASVGEGALDQLAGAAEFVDVPAGAVPVRQGDAADVFYVIESGAFAATARGRGRGRAAGHGCGRLLRRDRVAGADAPDRDGDRADRRSPAADRRGGVPRGPDPVPAVRGPAGRGGAAADPDASGAPTGSDRGRTALSPGTGPRAQRRFRS